MTELRTDPITGRSVFLVPGRSARPNEHAQTAPTATSADGCPFCEGNEARTPPELAAFGPPGRRPNEPGWYVRTIPNRYPTVEPASGSTDTRGAEDVAHTHSTSGYHEVVIESPSHAPLLPYHPRVHVERVLEMCRDRVAQLEGRVGVASVTLFENTGPESGGSLWHPHAQLVATVALPPELATELEGSGQYREEHGVSCAFEQVRDDELRDGLRAVHGDEWFDVFAPFASAFPYELRVVPRRHAASFSAISPNEVTALAELLPQLLKSLLAIIPGASYNLLVRAPVATISGADSYHWHLDICPRLLRPDGFDLASGFHVNTVPPEDAASRYRAAMGAKP